MLFLGLEFFILYTILSYFPIYIEKSINSCESLDRLLPRLPSNSLDFFTSTRLTNVPSSTTMTEPSQLLKHSLESNQPIGKVLSIYRYPHFYENDACTIVYYEVSIYHYMNIYGLWKKEIGSKIDL